MLFGSCSAAVCWIFPLYSYVPVWGTTDQEVQCSYGLDFILFDICTSKLGSSHFMLAVNV